MRVTVKTTNLTLTPALATYLTEKLDAIAKVLSGVEKGEERGHAAVVARVELGRTTRHHRKGEIFRAELTLDVPRHPPLRAEAQASDVRTAIDRMRDEAKREIRSWKERRAALVKRGGRTLKRRIHGEER